MSFQIKPLPLECEQLHLNFSITTGFICLFTCFQPFFHTSSKLIQRLKTTWQIS